MIEIVRLQHHESTELLLRLGKWTIGGGHPRTLKANRPGGAGAVQRLPIDHPTGLPQRFVERDALGDEGFPLANRHVRHSCFVVVPQTQELHGPISAYSSAFRVCSSSATGRT